MREKRNYMVITFRCTSDAIAMEKYCSAHRIPGRIIPVPREISASCGLAWRMGTEEYAEYEAAVGAAEIEYEDKISLAF